MNFVTAKELTIALDSLNEWMAENPDLRLIDIRLGKCTSKEIKLFYQKYKQSLEDFESLVNDFMATVEVIDVKYTEATVGNSEDMDTLTSVMVLYK